MTTKWLSCQRGTIYRNHFMQLTNKSKCLYLKWSRLTKFHFSKGWDLDWMTIWNPKALKIQALHSILSQFFKSPLFCSFSDWGFCQIWGSGSPFGRPIGKLFSPFSRPISGQRKNCRIAESWAWSRHWSSLRRKFTKRKRFELIASCRRYSKNLYFWKMPLGPFINYVTLLGWGAQ